jgi:hypothetical protein
MREIRSSGSVEGVMGNHDSYSDRDRSFTWHGVAIEESGTEKRPLARQPLLSDRPIAGYESK